MLILKTERLDLRHLEPSDLEPLFELYRDPEIRQYYPDGTRSYEQTKQELEWFRHGHPKDNRLGLWAVVERGTGQFLGRCGLLPWHIAGQDEVELAFMIRKQRWREGFAAEASRGIIKYAVEQLRLRRLVCLVTPGNTASAAVARKLGMHMEREFEDEYGPCELFAMSLPASEA